MRVGATAQLAGAQWAVCVESDVRAAVRGFVARGVVTDGLGLAMGVGRLYCAAHGGRVAQLAEQGTLNP